MMKMTSINAWPELKHENAELIDVRTDEEFNSGRLKGSQQINVSDPNFPHRIVGLDKSKDYYLYCRSGARSAMAAGFMIKEGFTSVTNLEGGIMDWKGEIEV